MAVIDFGQWNKIPDTPGIPTSWVNDTGVFADGQYMIQKIDGTHYVFVNGRIRGSRVRFQDAKNLATDILFAARKTVEV